MCRGILRGNWRDRFRLPGNVRYAQRVCRRSFVRFAVGTLALAGGRLPRDCDTSRRLVVSLLSGLCRCDDPMCVLISWRSAGTNSVLLAQLMHAASTGSLVVFSPTARFRRSGNDMVCHLRRRIMGGRGRSGHRHARLIFLAQSLGVRNALAAQLTAHPQFVGVNRARIKRSWPSSSIDSQRPNQAIVREPRAEHIAPYCDPLPFDLLSRHPAHRDLARYSAR